MTQRIKRWWRRFNRSPFSRDLRLIRPQYRHLYRDRLNSGSLGKALNALFAAYRAGHLYDTRKATP